MRPRSTGLRWAAGMLGGMLLALLIAVLAAPAYLNRPEVRANIERTLSQRLGLAVTFERIDVALLPRPALTLLRVNAAIPRTFRGSFASVSMQPHLAPLLRGELSLSGISARGADVVIQLPETIAGSGPHTYSLQEGKEIAEQALASLAAAGPGIVIQAEGGTVTVVRAQGTVLSVRDAAIRVAAQPGALSVDLRGTADPWGRFLLKGRFLVDERAAEADAVTVQLGHSAVTGLTARLEWASPQNFEVRSEKASFALAELFRWFSSLEVLHPLLQGVTGLSGEADVASLLVAGPLARPGSWKWSVRGDLKHVVLGSGRLPAPLGLDGQFTADERGIRISGASASLGKSRLSGLSFRFSWNSPQWLQVFSGSAVLSLDEVQGWRPRLEGLVPRDLQGLAGTVRVTSLGLSGPLLLPGAWKVSATGEVENVRFEAPQLPGPVLLHRGAFTADRNAWSFSHVEASMQDTSLVADGSLHVSPGGIDKATVTTSGSIGDATMQRLFTLFDLPPHIVRSPVTVSGLQAAWQQPETFSLRGRARVADGPSVEVDLERSPEAWQLKRLTLSDPSGTAVLAARSSNEGTDLSFSGTLTQSAVAAIFTSQPPGPGVIAGELSVKVPAGAKLDMEARGSLEVRDLAVPWDRKPPLRIEKLSVQADGTSAVVREAAFLLGDSRYDLTGEVSLQGKNITVVGNASADHIAVPELVEALSRPRTDAGPKAGQGAGPGIEVHGLVRVRTADLLFAARRFSAVHAQAAFGPEFLSITFTRAESCGLAVRGTIEHDRKEWKIDLQASATNGSVGELTACLTGDRVRMSGAYDLRADLRSTDRGEGLLPELEGRIELTARDGTIYQYPLLAKIFSVLSVSEILRGRLPELGGSGFPYHTLTLKADIKKGALTVDEALIDGTSLTVVAEGGVDLKTRKADLVVLVAPFSTVNWFIRHIPIVGRLLGGTLISMPVRVTGDPADPHVVLLSPTAVGSRIIRLLENIVKLPVEIISPLLPGTGEQEK